MNGRIVKKIRKFSKRNWFEYVNAISQWPLSHKIRFSWYILTHNGKQVR